MGFGSNNVNSSQRKMQLISLKKTGLATPALAGSDSSFCTITDNGVGDSTINLTKKPLTQVPEVIVSSKTSATVCRVGTVTALAVQVLSFAMDGTTPAEADYDILIVGSLATDLIGG
jgi:hypothetical protein